MLSYLIVEFIETRKVSNIIQCILQFIYVIDVSGSMMGDKILLIETQFFDEMKLSGYFILLPDMDGYSKILSSLGMGDVQL